jgi:anti-sigma-K factor RskA
VNQEGRQYDHRDYEDLLAAATLGVLEPDQHTLLLAHVRTCDSCRSALGRLQSATDSLPMTVEAMAPSSALRDRLAAQIAATPRTVPAAPAPVPIPLPDYTAPVTAMPVPDPLASRRWAWLSAAAAMLLVGLAGGIAIGWAWLQGNDEDSLQPQEIALESPTGMDLTSAHLMYMPEEGMIHFSDPGMPEPPADHVYQVWLIEGEDTPPAPMGTIDMESGEFASTVDPDRHRVFAVTVEPAPIGSAGPTTDPVIVATLPDPES